MIIIEKYEGPLHGIVLHLTDNGDYAVHDFNTDEAKRLGWSEGLGSGDYSQDLDDARHDFDERVKRLRRCLVGDLRVLSEKLLAKTAPAPDTLDLLGETQASMRGDA